MSLFIGKLDPRVPVKDIEALFAKYGQCLLPHNQRLTLI
jgi:hypothetical protein